MTQVVNTIQINNPLEEVFDLVTTTRFWPLWYPTTMRVEGVTERPMALGDKIREYVQIGGRLYEGNWTVVEHVRPTRVTLRMETGRIQITCAFQSLGQATEFKRELEFYAEDFSAASADPLALKKLMYAQSEQALRKLKQSVETVLQREAMLEMGDANYAD